MHERELVLRELASQVEQCVEIVWTHSKRMDGLVRGIVGSNVRRCEVGRKLCYPSGNVVIVFEYH